MISYTMRKSFVLLIRVVAAVLLFGIVVAAGVGLWKWYASLPQHLATSMFGAAVALMTVLATKSWERRRDIDREQRANRIPAYQRVLAALFNYVHESASDPARADQELKKTFAELNSQMIIWASDPVISAYVTWRSSIGSGSSVADMFRLGELLLTIRKDVGHQNKNVSAATVLQVFVNDLNAALAAEIAKLRASAAVQGGSDSTPSTAV
jgi:hypothetical protein